MKPKIKINHYVDDYFPFRPVTHNAIYFEASPLLRGAILNCLIAWYEAGRPENALEKNLEHLSGLATSSYIKYKDVLREAVMQIKQGILDVYGKESKITATEKARREKCSKQLKEYWANKTKKKQLISKLVDVNEADKLGSLPQKELHRPWEKPKEYYPVKPVNVNPLPTLKNTLKDV